MPIETPPMNRLRKLRNLEIRSAWGRNKDISLCTSSQARALANRSPSSSVFEASPNTTLSAFGSSCKNLCTTSPSAGFEDGAIADVDETIP